MSKVEHRQNNKLKLKVITVRFSLQPIAPRFYRSFNTPRSSLKPTVEPLKTDTDKTDTSIKRTLNLGSSRFFSHLLYFKSLKDGHLSKTDNGHLKIPNGQLKSPLLLKQNAFNDSVST